MKNTRFYRELVQSNKSIDKIFAALPKDLTEEDFEKMYHDINDQLEKDFDTYKVGESDDSLVGQFKMPDSIFKRIRIAVLILDSCRYGTPYSISLFNRTINFFMKKDLRLKKESLN